MAPPQVGARVSMALYLPSVAVPEVTNGLRYSLSDRADANLTGGLPLMRMMQQFSTEEAARAYFEQIRWPDERRFCPHCGNADTARIWKVTPNPERRIVIADKSGKRMITFDVKAKKLLIAAGKGDVEIAVAKKLVFDSEDLEIKTKKTGKIEIGTRRWPKPDPTALDHTRARSALSIWPSGRSRTMYRGGTSKNGSPVEIHRASADPISSPCDGDGERPRLRRAAELTVMESANLRQCNDVALFGWLDARGSGASFSRAKWVREP